MELQSTQTLSRAGSGATLALQEGLNSNSPEIRLHCARLLALRGDRSGDHCLQDMLRAHGNLSDSLGAMAETYLISIWDERDGPSSALRDRLTRPRPGRGGDAEILSTLNDLLEKYPAWSKGYVERARVYQRNGEGTETRRQALLALTIEPDNFEAVVLLSNAYLLLDAPEQAYVCLQQALQLNPRLKHALHDEIREAMKAIELGRAQRRRERRKETPVI